jgi:hypothetical protein
VALRGGQYVELDVGRLLGAKPLEAPLARRLLCLDDLPARE